MKQLCAIAVILGVATLGSAAFDPAAFNHAVELYSQHQAAEARQAFEALAVSNPDNADIQFYLGRLALQRNDWEGATAHLEKAATLSPKDSRIHLRLGDAYGLTAQKAGFFSQLGWAKKCRLEYEKAVELDPQNVDARWSLMEYCRQAPSIVGGGNDKAMVQAEEIKKLDIKRGRLAVASVYAADKKYDLAFAEFDEALKANPDDYTANYQIGRLAAMSGERLAAGLAALRRSLALPVPNDPGTPGRAAANWRIGNILEKQGDKPGARTAYEEALKGDPQFQPAVESLKKL